MKIFLFTLLATLFCVAPGQAASASIPPSGGSGSVFFQDDLNKMDQEFEGLNELENVVARTGATASELAQQQNPALRFLDPNADVAASLLGTAAPKGEKLLGIPGFAWGFCFGLIGVVLVYVAIDDAEAKKKEGKQALIGCAIAYAIIGVIYAVAIAQAAKDTGTTTNSGCY